LTRPWLRAVPGLVALALVAGVADLARAAAEVHKLNLVLNAIPTSIAGGDFNDVTIKAINANLNRRGLETLDNISYGWMFGAELRYFLRPNFAVAAGVGQLRSTSKREYTFSRSDDVTIRAEILSVPIHVGGDYYFTPYNQGDFQARAYVGGGILSLTNTYGKTAAVSNTTVNPGVVTGRYAGDAPGWYFEVGAHMFFAVRYSLMLGAIYRSAMVQSVGVYSNVVNGVPTYPDERLQQTNYAYKLDTSGAGARMSVAIGF
jgi:hypothetical protein